MINWNLLKDRSIINIIIGDDNYKNDVFIDYRMPNMSGQDIWNFGYELGIEKDYWKNQKKSRWQYMEDVLSYVIEKGKINEFFKKLLELKRFKKISALNPYKSVSELYWECINCFMQKINELLFFEKCHIEYNFETWKFSLVNDEENIKIESESIDKVDREYILRVKEEIFNSIKEGDYESTITKTRGLLEEVMIYGIELKGEEIDAKGNINKLYQKFKTLYNMHQNKNMDNRINSLLSGLEKIVTAISEMRDVSSDAHGAGKRRIKLEEHHAILISNAAVTMSEFLLSVVNNNI